jgi:hypothetical protein
VKVPTASVNMVYTVGGSDLEITPPFTNDPCTEDNITNNPILPIKITLQYKEIKGTTVNWVTINEAGGTFFSTN